MSRYLKYVRCNGPCAAWIPRKGLPDQTWCKCGTRFRTGPKDLTSKRKYDDLLTRY